MPKALAKYPLTCFGKGEVWMNMINQGCLLSYCMFKFYERWQTIISRVYNVIGWNGYNRIVQLECYATHKELNAYGSIEIWECQWAHQI